MGTNCWKLKKKKREVDVINEVIGGVGWRKQGNADLYPAVWVVSVKIKYQLPTIPISGKLSLPITVFWRTAEGEGKFFCCTKITWIISFLDIYYLKKKPDWFPPRDYAE